MMHQWLRTYKEHPPPEAWERSFIFGHVTGEGLKQRVDILAKIQRLKSGEWSWWATVDRRRCNDFGHEPTMFYAQRAAMAALMRPVRV